MTALTIRNGMVVRDCDIISDPGPAPAEYTIPGAFVDNLNRVLAGLDWSRVFARTERYPAAALELDLTAATCDALAASCRGFATQARERARANGETPDADRWNGRRDPERIEDAEVTR